MPWDLLAVSFFTRQFIHIKITRTYFNKKKALQHCTVLRKSVKVTQNILMVSDSSFNSYRYVIFALCDFTLCHTLLDTHLSFKSRTICRTHLLQFLSKIHCALLIFFSIRWPPLCMLCWDTIFCSLQLTHSTNSLVPNMCDT